MRKLLILAILVLLVPAACGDDTDAPPSDELLSEASSEGGISLPDPVEAIPAYLISPGEPADEDAIERLESVDGVNIVVAATVRKMEISGPEGSEILRVAAVDPLEYRSIAPVATNEAEFVWTSLLSGEAVLTFDAAEDLGIDDGGTIEMDGGRSMEVGAFADNQTPNIADVVVDGDGGQVEGAGDQVLTVGVQPGTSLDALGTALSGELPDSKFVPLIPPDLMSNPDPLTGAMDDASSGGGIIGTMNYKILENGFIKPEQAWVDSNISSATVSIIGEVTCHRLMIPQLQAALSEIESAGLANELRPNDYGGCYVPRFIDRNPSLPLSMHAFGLAVDINVSTNQLGTEGDMNPRIVEIFERWGFVWGGDWSRPDPMHFELGSLVDTD
jgi:hypothetical protein